MSLHSLPAILVYLSRILRNSDHRRPRLMIVTWSNPSSKRWAKDNLRDVRKFSKRHEFSNSFDTVWFFLMFSSQKMASHTKVAQISYRCSSDWSSCRIHLLTLRPSFFWLNAQCRLMRKSCPLSLCYRGKLPTTWQRSRFFMTETFCRLCFTSLDYDCQTGLPARGHSSTNLLNYCWTVKSAENRRILM